MPTTSAPAIVPRGVRFAMASISTRTSSPSGRRSRHFAGRIACMRNGRMTAVNSVTYLSLYRVDRHALCRRRRTIGSCSFGSAANRALMSVDSAHLICWWLIWTLVDSKLFGGLLQLPD